MKSRIVYSIICIFLMLSLCSCTIRSDKPVSDKVINGRKEAFENYLKETYPDQTFTVEVWQEYGTDIGGAGLPDYEGYLIRQVITDSEGRRFQIHGDSKDDYYDDYQKVLDGWIEYDEKGELILTGK